MQKAVNPSELKKGEKPKVHMRKKGIEMFDLINISVLMLLALVIIYPFYNSILISLVSETEYVRRPFMLFPRDVIFDSYRYILGKRGLFYGYRATLFVLAFGVPLKKGEIILSGAFSAALIAVRGDVFNVEFSSFGNVQAEFV